MKDLFLYLQQLFQDNGLVLSLGLPDFEEQQKDNPLYVATFENDIREQTICGYENKKIDVVIGRLSGQYSIDNLTYTENLENLEAIANLIKDSLQFPITFGDTRILAYHNHLVRDVGLDNALRFLHELVVTISWQ